MDCNWTADRLVALQDDELSRSEVELISEHLARCPECTELEAALADVTPLDALMPDPEWQRRLAEQIDAALDEEFANPLRLESDVAVAPPVIRRTRRWLRRDRDLSNGSMMAYGFLLAACLGWGIANWLTVAELRDMETVQTASSATGTTLPSDQYRPVSWTAPPEGAKQPEDEWR